MEPIKHTPKLWERHLEEGVRYFLFWCPACKCGHGIPTPRWGFDGNFSSPTFTPSLRRHWTNPDTGRDETLCHLNVTNGLIIYHPDCPHDMKGQTIPMQDLPPNYGF